MSPRARLSPKTALLRAKFAKLGLKNALIIGGQEVDANFKLAARNIPAIDVLPNAGLNVYDVLRRHTLVLTRSARPHRPSRSTAVWSRLGRRRSQLATAAKAVIGMSLGGLTAIALSAEAPELVRKIVLVDVLPGIKAQRAQHITDFVIGPASFASLDELLERTARFNPARSRSSLRRGILHNAEQQPDGTWVWRWARHRHPAASASPALVAPAPASPAAGIRHGPLWEALSSITVPLLLARGMRPDSVLDDDDERELLRRLPSAQVIHVEEAGHSLQGDTPLELAAIIEHFVFSS